MNELEKGCHEGHPFFLFLKTNSIKNRIKSKSQNYAMVSSMPFRKSQNLPTDAVLTLSSGECGC